MKFGVMIRGQCWLDDDMPAYFQDAMEQARLAQSLLLVSLGLWSANWAQMNANRLPVPRSRSIYQP